MSLKILPHFIWSILDLTGTNLVRFDVHRVGWLAGTGLFYWSRRLVCFGECRLLLDSNHASSQQRGDVSVSRFVAHDLPPF
jgi:hypothetical protein